MGVAVFSDCSRIVSGGGKEVKVWDAKTGTNLMTLTGHSNGVYSVAVFPDCSRIVSGGHDETVRVWDANTGDNLLTLTGHSGAVHSVAVFPDGSRIVSGDDDGTINIWEEDKMVLTRKANEVVDKIELNRDILDMIKDKLPTCRKN